MHHCIKPLLTLHLKIALYICILVLLIMATFRDRMAALRKNPSQTRPHCSTIDLTVYAHVVDLNRDSIISGQLLPNIHRSTSGHLIVPNYSAHACEKCRSRPDTESPTALDILRLLLGGGTNAFFHSTEEIVKINDGPARQLVIVEELSTRSMRTQGVNDIHACCGASLLRRKGCRVVNVVGRRSQVGISERANDEE